MSASEPFAVRWVRSSSQKHRPKVEESKENPTLSSSSPSINTMTPYSKEKPSSYGNELGVVIFVTPYGTGCLIAQEIAKRGYQTMALWTKDFSEEMKAHVPASCADLEYFAEVTQGKNDTLDDIVHNVKVASGPYPIVACMAGGEAGVDFADALSEKLGVLTNGTDIPNRRDKKLQQELVRDVGLRSVRQAGGETLDHNVLEFLQKEEYPVVVKPVESAGSDGVKLCHTQQEAMEHFELLMKNYEMVNGGECPSVLCQEFLKGKEYVVDHVSRDGVHKTTMLWVYDKRPTNGAAFVYYGCIPVDSESPEAQVLIPYVRGVLDALGIKNGPSHGEVMMTPDGPCLVEMNCRAHGGDGNWRPLARALTGGYSQVEASVEAYLDKEAFFALPDKPPSPFKASGQEVIFVSFSEGTVQSMPGFEVIKNLPSFVSLQAGVRQGSQVDYTVDLVTSPGGVILMHPDEAVLKRDVEFCRYMEKINGFFVYETKLESLKRPRGDSVCLESVNVNNKDQQKPQHRRVFSSDGPSLIRISSNDRPELRGPLVKRMTTVDASKEIVVVVNPYSTGYLVIKEILNRTYQVIALWTKDFPPEMKTHVPLACENMKLLHHVQEADTVADTVKQLYKAAGQFRIVACIAGGETGLELTDAISERLEVRTNGTAIPNRRNKRVQQELIKAAGLRAVRQAAGESFHELEEFLLTESYPVVVKPIESGGPDGVKLCHNLDEAKEHFDLLIQSQPAVLCQEFLKGKEYVVDHVSRDGDHKTVMIWEYDKRPVNGAKSVYFGSVPVDPESPNAKLLIPYIRKVLDAMQVKNGPSHGEVVMTPTGPCLVEMKCRTHGGDGSWKPLARALTGGYTQVEATVDAYLDKKQFHALPNVPPSPLKASGQEVILVSFSRGKVKSAPGFEVIKELESFVYLETGVHVGSSVDYTVDLFTGLGSVMLMHPDKDVLEGDVARIRQMERDNELFEYEEQGHIIRSGSRLRLSENTSSGRHQRLYASHRADIV